MNPRPDNGARPAPPATRHGAGSPLPSPFGAHWRHAEWLPWLVIIAAYFIFPDRLLLGTQILVAGIFALSLDLALGFGGIVTLGHAAYFGFGAYTAGWLAKYGWHEPISAVLLAAAASGVLGWLTSALVGAGTGLRAVMVTLGLNLVLFEAANKASDLTGGVDGMQGIDIAPILGRFTFDLDSHVAYIYAAGWLLLGLLVTRHMVSSPFGLTLKAIRMNPVRTRALGINNARVLRRAYTAAAILAGIAGAVLAQSTQYVELDVLAMHRSTDVVTMLIIGGAGYLYGGLIGAAVFIALQDTLSDINPAYWEFWVGLALVVIVLVIRDDGLLGLLRRARDRTGQRWKRRAPSRPAEEDEHA